MASSFSYRGITKVGEGSEKQEHEVPIEIRAIATLDWLLDRNVVSRAWAKQASACRKDGKDFVALVEHMESLLASGRDTSKGLFGGYNDAALNACEAAMAAYRKGNTHMAECAAELAQSVKYTAPSEKKTIEKTHKQLADLDKLDEAAAEEVASLTRHYERQCVELGVPVGSADVARDLEALVDRLPVFCEGIVAAARAASVKRALAYYGAFVRYVESITGGAAIVERCPVLSVVIDKGNVSRAEFANLCGGDNSKAIKPKVRHVVAEENEPVWEIEDMADDDDETLLSAADSRAEYLDNLHELLSFLQGRIREKTSSEASSFGLQDALLLSGDCPEVVRSCDAAEQLQQLRDGVAHVIALVDAPQFSQLAEIKASRQYVARLAALVQKRAELIETAKEQRAGLRLRRQALVCELANARERLDTLSKREQKLRAILQTEIGKKFNRPVDMQ